MAESSQCPQCGSPLPGSTPGGLCPACLLKRGLAATTAGFTAAETRPESARWAPPAPADLAPRFPELEILELIGRGGMGAVYKARQKNLQRVVALKILPPEIGRDPAFADRFAREAQALARLSHPHIVAIHDFGEREGLYFFLMEYVDGLNLRQLLDSGNVTPKEALAIVPQICEALQFAHDQGIVHRDIKPENILLDKRGRVKIADFGLAKLMGQGGATALADEQAPGTAGGSADGVRPSPRWASPAANPSLGAGQVMGTPQYMAPEQVDHPKDVDHRADIYSLGVVFYQMLTGELPVGRFQPPSRKVLIDVRLDEVVLKAMEKEPDRRYQQASQVKTEVETILTTPAGVAALKSPALPGDESTGPSGGGPASDGLAAPAVTDLEDARRQVRGPAIAILVLGILNACLVPGIFLMAAAFLFRQSSRVHAVSLGDTQGEVHGVDILMLPLVAAALLVPLALVVLMIVAGLKMKRLEARGLAIAGSILSMIMVPTCFIGLGIGIWSLVVLSRKEVREAFQRNRRAAKAAAGGPDADAPAAEGSTVAPAAAPAGPADRVALWLVRGIYAFAIFVLLWPVVGVVLDFPDRGHLVRFALCLPVAFGVALLGKLISLLMQFLIARARGPQASAGSAAATSRSSGRAWRVLLLIVAVVWVLGLAGALVALSVHDLITQERSVTTNSSTSVAPAGSLGLSPWGEDVQGIRVRLRAGKTYWNLGEVKVIALEADGRSDGTSDFTFNNEMREIEVDGVWYGQLASPVPAESTVQSVLRPGMIIENHQISLGLRWVTKAEPHAPLALSIGKHRIRLAWVGLVGVGTEKVVTQISAVSNVVEIEVVAAPVGALVGVWKVRPGQEDAEDILSVTFNVDATCLWVQTDGQLSGTYEFDGTTLTLRLRFPTMPYAPPLEEEVIARIEGSTLTLSPPRGEAGKPFVLDRVGAEPQSVAPTAPAAESVQVLAAKAYKGDVGVYVDAMGHVIPEASPPKDAAAATRQKFAEKALAVEQAQLARVQELVKIGRIPQDEVDRQALKVAEAQKSLAEATQFPGPLPVAAARKEGAEATVSFQIPESYTQTVVKKLEAKESLKVDVYSPDRKSLLATGSLVALDNQIDPKTGTLGCRARVLPQNGAFLYSNLSVSVRMLVETKRGVTLVPAEALQRLGDAQFIVYVISPGDTVSRRSIAPGAIDAGVAGITAGLAPGELVVVDGKSKLEGMGRLVEGSKVQYRLIGEGIPELKNLVALCEKEVKVVQQQASQGLVTPVDVCEAEVKLLDARIQLADAEGEKAVSQSNVLGMLEQVVQLREKQYDLVQKMYGAGILTSLDVSQAEKKVVEAKLRLAQRRGDDKPPSAAATPPSPLPSGG